MSFEAMTWAVKKECKNSSQKLVLLMLANYSNGHTGQCNPSQRRLAIECCMSVSSLKVQIKALEDKEFLEIIHKSKNGVQIPNQYKLNINDEPLQANKINGSDLGGVGQNLTGGGSESDGGVGQNLTGGGSESGYKPVIKPGSKTKERETKEAALVIPEFIHQHSWTEFEQHRKEIKKPLTDLARKKCFSKLEGLSAGEQQAVIDYSIAGRYTGLFTDRVIKKQGGNHAAGSQFAGQETNSQRNARISQETSRQFQETIADSVAAGVV